eukprot:m.57121 g.57121  ORF g.57121 m.57121 type:complete len:124 (+) comp7730_c0_seq1:100-471(+)
MQSRTRARHTTLNAPSLHMNEAKNVQKYNCSTNRLRYSLPLQKLTHVAVGMVADASVGRDDMDANGDVCTFGDVEVRSIGLAVGAAAVRGHDDASVGRDAVGTTDGIPIGCAVGTLLASVMAC